MLGIAILPPLSEIIYEDLTFVSWQDRYPKHVKRKLSRWIKGYIQQRINYKGALKSILLTKVNLAYTSQFCPNCGKINADFNASCNVKARKNIKEITIYTPYKQVKEILLKRIQVS